MSLFPDLLPVVGNQSDPGLDNLVLPQAPLPGYSEPNPVSSKSDQQRLDEAIRAPSDLATKFSPVTFDWEKSNADRYVGSTNYRRAGFDPYLGTQTVEGKPYDANELKYGALQTWSDVMSNAVGGSWNLAKSTFVEGWKGWGHIANALFSWNSDNSFKERLIGTSAELKELDNRQKAIMNKYAIYHTPEGDNGFFNKQFLGDIVQQAGFGIGAGAQLLAETLITGGISDAISPLFKAGKLAAILEEGAITAESLARNTVTTAERINDLRKTSDITWNNTLMNNIWEGAKSMVPGRDIYKAYQAGEGGLQIATIGVGGVKRAFSEANMAMSEARMESASTYGQLYGELLSKYQDEHDGKMPTGDDLDRIKSAAYGAGTDNFIVNTGILMGANRIQLDNMLSKYGSSRRMFREAAESGNHDIFTVTGKLKTGDQIATRAYEKGRFGMFSDVSNIRKDFGIGTALWEGVKQGGIKFELSEGVQEILQSASDNTFRDYYTNLYNGGKDLEGRNLLSDISEADLGKGLSSQMNMEGWKTFLMGATTGLFLSPLYKGVMYAQRKGYQFINKDYKSTLEEEAVNKKTNLDILNAFYKDPANFLNANIANSKLQGKISSNMEEAIANNDQYEFFNSKEDGLSIAVATAIKTGNYDSMLDTIRDFSNHMSDEEFQKAFNLTPTTGNRLSAKEFIGSVVRDIEHYHDNWQNLKDQYSGLVKPEQYTSDSKRYVQARIAKRALDEAIELLATTSWKATKAIERTAAIKAELGQIPGIGQSVAKGVDILNDLAYTHRELQLLEEQRTNLAALGNSLEVTTNRKSVEEQIKYLTDWREAFAFHQALSQAPKDIYEQEGIAKAFTDNRDRMLSAYKSYVQALNSQYAVGQQTINQQDVEKAFKGTVDHIALTRDNRHYVEALNILTDPENFLKLYDKITDAEYHAKISLWEEHKEEIKKREKAATKKTTTTTPVQDVRTVDSFVERMKKGEQLSTPEDLEFYENNKKEIGDKLLQPVPKKETDFAALREEFLNFYVPEVDVEDVEIGGVSDVGELSQEAIDYQNEHPEFLETINRFNTDFDTKSLRKFIEKTFNKEIDKPLSFDNLHETPYVIQVSNGTFSVVKETTKGKVEVIKKGLKTLEEANKKLKETYPVFAVGEEQFQVGQYLYKGADRYVINSYNRVKDQVFVKRVPFEGQTGINVTAFQIKPEELLSFTETSIEEVAVPEPVVEDSKMQILHSQIRVGANNNDKALLTQLFRTVPSDQLMDGISIIVTKNPTIGESFYPIQGNIKIKQHRQPFSIQLNKGAVTLGYLTNSDTYSFDFDGVIKTSLTLTPNEFAQVFDTQGRDPAALLLTFQNDYKTAVSMQATITKALGKKDTVTLTDKFVNKYLLFNRHIELNYRKKGDPVTLFKDVQVNSRIQGEMVVINNSTGEFVFADAESIQGISKRPEGNYGMYSAFVELPTGDRRWIQLSPAAYDKENLNSLLVDVKKLVDSENVRDANKLLSAIFIALPVYKTVDGQVTVDEGQKHQIRLAITGDKKNMSVHVDTLGKYLTLGTNDFTFAYKDLDNVDILANAINKEVSKKLSDVSITTDNFHVQSPINPTEEQVLNMAASVLQDPIRNISLTFGVKDTSAPIESEPTVTKKVTPVTGPVEGGGYTDETPELLEDVESMNALRSALFSTRNLDAEQELKDAKVDTATDILIEQGEDPLTARRKARGNKGTANKILATEGFDAYSVENIDRFKEWMQENLPMISVEGLDTLVDNLGFNNVVVGRFLTDLKTIQTNPESPFKYHEAFHGVFRFLLTQDQIDSLIQSADKQNPITKEKLDAFRNHHSLYKEMGKKELERLYQEEYLADLFDKWKNDRNVKTSFSIKSFFVKLLDWIKGIFSKLTGSEIQGLFYDINTGRYKNVGLQNNEFTNSEFGITDPAMKVIEVGKQEIESNGKIIEISRYLPQQQSDQISSTVAALFYQETQSLPQFNKNEVLDKILDRYADLLNPDQQRYKDFAAGISNKAERNNWADKLLDRYDLFIEEVSRQSIKEAVDVHLRIMGYKQELEDDELASLMDEYGERNTELFDRNNGTIGGFGSLAKFLRQYIGGTTYQFTDEFKNTHFNDGVPIVQGVNANAVYNGLLKVLSNTSDSNKLLDRLISYRNRGSNPETVTFINELFRETGFDPIAKTASKNQILLQQVIKGFNQYSSKYLFVQADKGKYVVSFANTKDSARNQIDQWQSSFDKQFWQPYVTKNAAEKKKFVKEHSVPLTTLNNQFKDESVKKKAIPDIQLQELSQRLHTEIENNLGINWHPLYIQYSILKGKNYEVLTPEQRVFVVAYNDVVPITPEQLQANIINPIEKGKNLFTRIEGDAIDIKGNPYGYLSQVAANNATFDETVNTMSFTNANGETVYAHQLPNFHTIAITELNDEENYNKIKNDPDKKNFLTESDEFNFMQENKQIAIYQADGMKKVSLTESEEKDEFGESVVFVNNKLEVNRERGVTYGDFNSREFIAFLLGMYDTKTQPDSRVRRSADKNDFFIKSAHLLRVIESKNTGHLVKLPILKAVTSIGNNIVKPSANAVNIIYSWVQEEIERIKTVREEVGGNTVGYHTKAQRGLKLFRTAAMIGDMASVIESEDYQINEKAIKDQITKYWTNQIQEFVEDLEELGLIKIVAGKIENVLLPDYLFKGFGDENFNEKTNLKSNFLHNIGQVFMNDYLNTTGINQLILGNEALSFKNAIDQIKRAAGKNASGPSMDFAFTSPSLGIDHELSHFHHVTFEDPTFTKMDGSTGEQADAQMYGTEKGLRYMLFGFGKLNKVQADILDKLKNGTPVTREEFFSAGGLKDMGPFNPFKLVFDNGSTYLKNSMIPLFKEFTSYRDYTRGGEWVAIPGSEKLHDLRVKMEQFEQGNETIVFAHPVSASKGLKKNVASSIDAIKNENFNQLEARWMRLQLENPSNKLSITDPTQAKQQIMAEQSADMKETVDSYMQDISDRTTNNYNSAVSGIFTIDDAKVELDKSTQAGKVTANLGNFMKRATETLRATGSDAQTLGFFETDDNGDPIYNLNFPSTLQKFTQIFLAYFSRGVMSEKVPGYTLALVSNYGVKKLKRVTSLNENGQPRTWDVIPTKEFLNNPAAYSGYKIWSDDKNRLFTGLVKGGDIILDDLRHNVPEYNEYGEIVGRFSEFLMPAHYKEQMNKRIKDLEKGFGVRIPSDDKHSYISLRMVDELPVVYGSSGIFPQELLEISGADFDIDKIFISIADTYSTGDTREAYGTATTDKGKFEEYILWNAENNKKVKDAVQELQNTRRGLVAQVMSFGRDIYVTAMEKVGLPSTVEEFMEKGGEKLNNGVLNNRILAAKLALLNNENISGGEDAIINQPTSTAPLTNLVKELIETFERLEGEGIPEILSVLRESIGDVNSLSGKLSAYTANKEGSRNIGAAVNSMLTYSLMNQFGVSILGDKLYFDGHMYDTFGENRAYNKETDSYIGTRIFASISAIVNAMTDNAKERLAAKLGLNIQAVGYVSNMIAQGVPMRSAVLYMLQPVVRDYFKQIQNLKGILKTPEESRKSSSAVLDKMISEYTGKAIEQSDESPLVQLDEKILIDNIKDNGKDNRIQYSILMDLQIIDKQSSTLRQVADIMKLTQGLPTTIEEFDEIKKTLIDLGYYMDGEEFENSSLPFDIRGIFKDQKFLNTNIRIVEQLDKLMPSVFLEKTAAFKRIQDVVNANLRPIRQLEEGEFNRNLKYNLISYLSIQAYIKYLKDNGQQGALKSLDHAMIYDSAKTQKAPDFENIIDIMKRLQDTLKGKNENYLVSRFLLQIPSSNDSNRDLINKVESNTWAKLSEHQQERLVDSFIDLYTNSYRDSKGKVIKTHNDAIALFNYLLVKDGGQFKSNTFLRFIPNFVFKDLLDNTGSVNKLLSDKYFSEQERESAYKNVLGVGPLELFQNFLDTYGTHISNKFYIKPIALYAVQGYVPEGEGVSLDRVKKFLPKSVDIKTGNIEIDIFKNIREQGKKGTYDSTEGALLGKNIEYIKNAGFTTIKEVIGEKKRTKVEFPYSVKFGEGLYVLQSIDGKEGLLIQKDQTLPVGTKAIYQKQEWRGSKGQWSGAGVFGKVPLIDIKDIKAVKVTNPEYAPGIPKEKDIVTETEPDQSEIKEQIETIEGSPVAKQLNDNYRISILYSTELKRNLYVKDGKVLDEYRGIKPSQLLNQLSNKPVTLPDLSALSALSEFGIPDEDIDAGLIECGLNQ